MHNHRGLLLESLLFIVMFADINMTTDALLLYYISGLINFLHAYFDVINRGGDPLNFDWIPVLKKTYTDQSIEKDVPGKSSTRDTKSYILQAAGGGRVEIIDVPGLGDTSGLKKDTVNADLLIKHLENIEYINALMVVIGHLHPSSQFPAHNNYNPTNNCCYCIVCLGWNCSKNDR